MTLSSGRFGELTSYWLELHEKCGAVPTWAHFNPVRMASLVPNLILVERFARDNLRYRLVGSSIDVTAGVPLTNTNLLDNYPSALRPLVCDLAEVIFTTPCGVVMVRQILFDGHMVESQSLVLPIRAEDGTIRQALSVTDMHRTRQEETMRQWELEGEQKFLRLEFVDLGFGLPRNKDSGEVSARGPARGLPGPAGGDIR